MAQNFRNEYLTVGRAYNILCIEYLFNYFQCMGWFVKQERDEEFEVFGLGGSYSWRRAYTVWGICVLVAVLFLVVLIEPGAYMYLALRSGGGFRFWQLLSAGFTDGDPVTVVGLIALMFTLGVTMEHELGGRCLLGVFYFSGLVSLLPLLLLSPAGMPCAGTLGGFCGVLAGALTHLGHMEVKFMGALAMRMRTMVFVILLLILILCVLSAPLLYLLVPCCGFGFGLLYCRLDGLLRLRKVVKGKSFKIEID